MPVISPVAGWRFDPGKADYAKVTTPPSWEISSSLQLELYKLDDRNCVRLLSGRDNAGMVAAHLDNWREESLFLQDKPAIYVYEQSFSLYGQTCHRRGFLARVLLSDIGTEGIYATGKSDPLILEKMLQTMRAARGSLEPVFAILSDPSADISRSIYQMCKYEPTASFHSSGEVMNHFWVQDNYEQAASFCGGCSQENLYIAAGQEIYDAAILNRNLIREAMKAAGHTPPALGGLECDYVLTFIVPDGDPGLKALPVHRLLQGFSSDAIKSITEILNEYFTLEPMADIDNMMWKIGESTVPAFGVAFAGKLYCCTKNEEIPPALVFAGMPDGWDGLDGILLHKLVLAKLPGWQTDNSHKLEYCFDTVQAMESLEGGDPSAQCAFLMRPPSMDLVRHLCRTGSMLPEHSLRFTPMPLSGLVFNFFW